MSSRTSATVVGTLVALVLAFDVGPTPSAATRGKTIHVRSEAQFQAAERALSRSGGTIVLLPHRYRYLIVRPRSGGYLRIVGTRGARVESFLFNETHHVSLGRVTIAPIRGDALVEVRTSHHIDLHGLRVTAKGTRFSSSVLIPDSRYVKVRRSNFSHCGDRSPKFVNCLGLYRWSHNVLVEDNWFHDCLGCDFVHGRFGSDLVIRRNRFERALPCRMNAHRCGHQDLVQFFAGRRLRVENNRFGVYRGGGAQLYLTNSVDYATIQNNVFVGTDRRVPGYHARMGIVIGAKSSRRLPHYAKVINNTILTGARRRDGYAGSIRMSSRYGSVKRWKRPIVANNVIALMERRAHVCSAAQRFLNNLVIRGVGCSTSDLVGPADLDRRGRPRSLSWVIDGANRHYAPRRDVTGRRRGRTPDIGAFEYRR